MGKVINEFISTKNLKNKVGAETFNTNQNHCEELTIHFSNLGKNISTKIDPAPTNSVTFLMSLFPICEHSHLPLINADLNMTKGNTAASSNTA